MAISFLFFFTPQKESGMYFFWHTLYYKLKAVFFISLWQVNSTFAGLSRLPRYNIRWSRAVYVIRGFMAPKKHGEHGRGT